MDQSLIYSCLGLALFGVGLYFLLIASHILRKILAVNVMGMGVFMLLVSTAQKTGLAADPVPHAMVLTGIVVAVAGTALALSLVSQIRQLNIRDGQPRQNDD